MLFLYNHNAIIINAYYKISTIRMISFFLARKKKEIIERNFSSYKKQTFVNRFRNDFGNPFLPPPWFKGFWQANIRVNLCWTWKLLPSSGTKICEFKYTYTHTIIYMFIYIYIYVYKCNLTKYVTLSDWTEKLSRTSAESYLASVIKASIKTFKNWLRG